MSNKNTKTKMTSYRAVGLAEGFEEGTREEVIEAWAYLIKTGMAWTLQGWFGRRAAGLIESGRISREGVIDWDKFDE